MAQEPVAAHLQLEGSISYHCPDPAWGTLGSYCLCHCEVASSSLYFCDSQVVLPLGFEKCLCCIVLNPTFNLCLSFLGLSEIVTGGL